MLQRNSPQIQFRTPSSIQTNLSLIAQDVEKRNYFYRKTASLLERKASIDNNYANLLENLLNKDFLRATDCTLSSQALYSKLIGIIQE